jgi:hypothetical protein
MLSVAKSCITLGQGRIGGRGILEWSTVVKYLTQHPELENSNPANDMGRRENGKKLDRLVIVSKLFSVI